jgi:glycosyltransferase involved in cell wall biosynthesis
MISVMSCRATMHRTVLTACLESLLAQTWQNFEIVAVNDGSTDGTLDVLRRASARDGRIRVFDRPHGGVVQAMNFAVEQSRGEYVARMDSDDICLPERLALQKRHLDRHPHLGLVGGLVRFGGDPAGGKGLQGLRGLDQHPGHGRGHRPGPFCGIALCQSKHNVPQRACQPVRPVL